MNLIQAFKTFGNRLKQDILLLVNTRSKDLSYSPTNPTDISTKSYVDTKQNQNIMVTITSSTTQDGGVTYNKNKTFHEIAEAYIHGTNIYIYYNGVNFEFHKATSENIVFDYYDPNSMLYTTFIIKSDDTISCTTKIISASETYGGVKASSKTEADTVEAKIGSNGKLYVPTYPTLDEYYTATKIDTKFSTINTKITNIINGSIPVKEAEHADSASIANHSTSSDSATKATQDGNGNVISDVYETKVDAQTKYDTLVEAKPDWNQNDETAIDYIKNRPFYEMEAVETVCIPETTASNFEERDYYGVYYGCNIPVDYYVSFSLDKTYTVIWDDIRYDNVTCQDTMGGAKIGSSERQIAGAYGETNEYPFGIIMYDSGDGYELQLVAETGQAHTVKVFETIKEAEFKAIDEKYIPETIARTKDIDERLQNISYNDLTDKPDIPSLTGYATENYVTEYAQPKGNYLTQHQDLSDYAKKATTLAGYGITNGATKKEVEQTSNQLDNTKLNKPSAEVGQMVVVKSVNNDGKAEELEAIDRTHGDFEEIKRSFLQNNFTITFSEATDTEPPRYTTYMASLFIQPDYYLCIFDGKEYITYFDTVETPWGGSTSIGAYVKTDETTLYLANYGEEMIIEEVGNNVMSGRSVSFQQYKLTKTSYTKQLEEKYIPETIARTEIVGQEIIRHDVADDAHSDIRRLISDLTIKFNNFLNVDDTTADQLSEVLTLIDANKCTVESLSGDIQNISQKATEALTNANAAVKAVDDLKTMVDTVTGTACVLTVENGLLTIREA